MTSALPAKEKGVIFIGNNKNIRIYESLIEAEFKDSKNIELRALGKAITNAIRICEKLVAAKRAIYTRFISETIKAEDKDIVRVIIKIRRNDGQRESTQERDSRKKDTRSEKQTTRDNRDNKPNRERDEDERDNHRGRDNQDVRDNQRGQRTNEAEKPKEKEKKKYVEKKQ